MRHRLATLLLTLPIQIFATEGNPESSPFQGDSDFASELTSLLTTMAVVFFVLIAAAWALRRLMAQRVQQLNEGSAIKVLERRAIAPKVAIYLLEVAGQGIVISESSTGISTLATLPPDTDLSNVGLGDSPEELTHPVGGQA